MITSHLSIRSKGVTLGTASDLSTDSMGVVCGHFHPAAQYEQFEDVFRLFTADRPEAYYAARDALGLEARLMPAGQRLDTRYVHIVDHRAELGPDGIELEVGLTGSVDAFLTASTEI